MNINIIGFRLPTATPDPTRHSSCGWVAICDNKEVGWCNMTFLPDNVLKLEDIEIKKPKENDMDSLHAYKGEKDDCTL